MPTAEIQPNYLATVFEGDIMIGHSHLRDETNPEEIQFELESPHPLAPWVTGHICLPPGNTGSLVMRDNGDHGLRAGITPRTAVY